MFYGSTIHFVSKEDPDGKLKALLDRLASEGYILHPCLTREEFDTIEEAIPQKWRFENAELHDDFHVINVVEHPRLVKERIESLEDQPRP